MPVPFDDLLHSEGTISSAEFDNFYPIEPSNGKPVVEHLQPVQPLSPPPEDTLDLSVPPWSVKSPDQWTPDEFAGWLCWWATVNGVPDSELTYLLYEPLSGFELCALDHQFFIDMCPQFGPQIYEALHQMVNAWHNQSHHLERNPPLPRHNYFSSVDHFSGPPVHYSTYLICDIENTPPLKPPDAHIESHSHMAPPIERLSPPPEDTVEDLSTRSMASRAVDDINEMTDLPELLEEPTEKTKTGKLWQFLRDLLSNPKTNPSMIKWVDKEEGRFKFVQCDKVAKLWGRRNFNTGMTYEKMSRAIRYYYKQQVLLPVPGQTHVYRFGPNAKLYLDNLKKPVFVD